MATCPITENGFLRTASALARGREPVGVADLVTRFQEFTSSTWHEFWSDEPSILDDELFDAELILGHQQLTDVYLLGLAVKRKAAPATFDPARFRSPRSEAPAASTSRRCPPPTDLDSPARIHRSTGTRIATAWSPRSDRGTRGPHGLRLKNSIIPPRCGATTSEWLPPGTSM